MTCERKNKWIGGCRFEARYNTNQVWTPQTNPPHVIGQVAKIRTQHDYVCDVCTRCGKRVEKQ